MLIFIIGCNHAFSIVEEPGFIDLLMYLNADMEMISKTTVRNRIFSTFVSTKSNIAALLRAPGNGRISTTTDLWKSGNNMSIIAVTGTFLNERFEMKEIVLGFRKLRGDHSGVNIANAFFAIIQEYCIENKVNKITLNYLSESTVNINLQLFRFLFSTVVLHHHG